MEKPKAVKVEAKAMKPPKPIVRPTMYLAVWIGVNGWEGRASTRIVDAEWWIDSNSVGEHILEVPGGEVPK